MLEIKKKKVECLNLNEDTGIILVESVLPWNLDL